jgi:1,4-dihydroxy-2-naphthoate octaprenyltransferase
MATAREWLHGARPRTLPAAVAPVAAGTGAAGAVDALCPSRALLALLVAVALQVGVNYANDYSDGVRGTDAERTGPLRLVGSGLASPSAVRAAALVSFGVAAVTGLVLAAMTTWWLLLVGAAAIVAAWFYTGGSRPYGYRGLGEVSVFVFFGLVATAGTTYVQAQRITTTSVLLGVGCGAFACAILVANNLRDLDGDQRVSKMTLAVKLGDRRTRWLYVALMMVPDVVLVPVVVWYPPAVLALLTAGPAFVAARKVLRGARGPELVAVLKATGLVLLAYGVVLLVALAWLSG